MVQDNNNNSNTIKHTDTEITIIVKTIDEDVIEEKDTKVPEPEPVYTHKSSDFMYNKSAATISSRQLGCMSNYNLEMHPRIITKDASYSFIWIDDQYKNIETLPPMETATTTKRHFFHTRGFCNLFTILFILAIILFLFIYPFATFFLK
ncbi:hypothetical protein INT46_005320 [Mucor plumbeus]|uniref:Uncharacterized protein n=1 Tax=Mucor plumbeus TaxID=97098 RepID=A0A8H7QR21_9FUNG|nr:hypothetical protein INT46_005320 [Mucor plumbeus]